MLKYNRCYMIYTLFHLQRFISFNSGYFILHIKNDSFLLKSYNGWKEEKIWKKYDQGLNFEGRVQKNTHVL